MKKLSSFAHLKRARTPGASHPHLKREKLTTMGKSAFRQGHGLAFPTTGVGAPPIPMDGGGGAPPMLGDGGGPPAMAPTPEAEGAAPAGL